MFGMLLKIKKKIIQIDSLSHFNLMDLMDNLYHLLNPYHYTVSITHIQYQHVQCGMYFVSLTNQSIFFINHSFIYYQNSLN
jgi:hypothetical protein